MESTRANEQHDDRSRSAEQIRVVFQCILSAGWRHGNDAVTAFTRRYTTGNLNCSERIQGGSNEEDVRSLPFSAALKPVPSTSPRTSSPSQTSNVLSFRADGESKAPGMGLAPTPGMGMAPISQWQHWSSTSHCEPLRLSISSVMFSRIWSRGSSLCRILKLAFACVMELLTL
jgi:hypothetical protein